MATRCKPSPALSSLPSKHLEYVFDCPKSKLLLAATLLYVKSKEQ